MVSYLTNLYMKNKTLTIQEEWTKKIFIVKSGDKQARVGVKYKNHLTHNLKFEIFSDRYNNGEEYEFDFNDLDNLELNIIALKSCHTFLKTGALTLEQLDNENINNTSK